MMTPVDSRFEDHRFQHRGEYSPDRGRVHLPDIPGTVARGAWYSKSRALATDATRRQMVLLSENSIATSSDDAISGVDRAVALRIVDRST